MQGFPKHIATRQDYENLLSMKEYKDEAITKLEELQDFDDRTATRAIKLKDPKNPEGEWEVEVIENPNPMHQQKGFKEWIEVVDLNARNTKGKKSVAVRKEEILSKYSKEQIEGIKLTIEEPVEVEK